MVLTYINIYSQYNWVTRYTPKGHEISAEVLTNPDYDYTQPQKDSIKAYWLNRYNYRITFMAEATRSYNCHGYAWHVSEGQDNVVIKTPNDDKYWTLGSYKEISPELNAKVAFLESADHSAIRTDQTDILISKWGFACRFRHHINDCPYNPKTGLKYYKLDPHMTGSTSVLCANVERLFHTDITHMPQGTLTWTPGLYITYVSGAGTPDYKVKGVGNGSSNVKLQINTPSGFFWESSIPFWAGKPIITNQKVDGSNYYSGFQICPGNHWLSVTPVGDGAQNATWTVPSGIPYFVGNNTLDFTLPSNISSLTISARSANACGTSTNANFYLVKKTYGCSLSFRMTLYPNPASDYVTILITEEEPLVESYDSNFVKVDIADAKLSQPIAYTINIYNNQGTVLSTFKRVGKSFEIPLNNFPDGIYVIEVSDGENFFRQQLMVKHN